jgi:hypothetical protein
MGTEVVSCVFRTSDSARGLEVLCRHYGSGLMPTCPVAHAT